MTTLSKRKKKNLEQVDTDRVYGLIEGIQAL